MPISDVLIVGGLIIDIGGVISLSLSGLWWGTPDAVNYVFMKRQVDEFGRGQAWHSAFFGFGEDEWESKHKAEYERMRSVARKRNAWRWTSLAAVVLGFTLQIIGQILEHIR